MKKTFSLKQGDVKRHWVVVDAASAPLGRLASMIANRLTGKYKPTYTPNIDDGDYVIVTNSDNLIVTGNKEDAKTYYRHSGFPGGIKSRSLKEVRQLDSTQIVTKAVRGMLPKNKLSAERLARLRVFPTDEHSHTAQKPTKLEVAKPVKKALSSKTTKETK